MMKANYIYDEEDHEVFVDHTTGDVFTFENGGWEKSCVKWGEAPFDHLYKPIKPEAPTETDNVNSPSHYGAGNIECIDYLEDFLSHDEWVGYLRGNIGKYMHRWRFKGKPVEDLKKARWYLDKLIETVENGEDREV